MDIYVSLCIFEPNIYTMNQPSIIAENIRLIREFLSLSQEEFGRRLNITRAIVRDYESGKTKPKKIVIARIANGVGITPTELIQTKVNIDKLQKVSFEEIANTDLLNVRRIREYVGFTQQALADATGIPLARLSKWELGKGSPKYQDAQVLKNFLLSFTESKKPSAPAMQATGKNMILVSEEDLRRIIKESVEDALFQMRNL